MDNLQEEFNRIKEYDFDFENLVFEGGGVKMGGYAGVVKVLEAMGILRKCKRFAGTSAGAIYAMLLACNATMDEVKRYMVDTDAVALVSDSKFGPASLLPNVFRKYGWNPAKKLLNSYRDELKRLTGDPDITFEQIYKQFGNTLCIIAMNVSTMSVEYFHPKTTPHYSVAKALRCSASLPGLLQPPCDSLADGTKQFYLDGGLVCNFPIHVFDGWYLSMDPKDSFFAKLGSENPFGTFNPKTLGFVLYTPFEGEFKQDQLHQRYGGLEIKRPNTKLAKKRGKACQSCLTRNLERDKTISAGKRLLTLLREMDVNMDSEISLDEFRNAFIKLELNPDDVRLLFGENFNFGQAFYELDKDHNGQITFDEFIYHLQKKGIDFRHVLDGGQMMQIESIGDFFGTAFSTVLNMTRLVHFKEDDMHRTAGIYTDYVNTSDFGLEAADIKFMHNQGITGTVLYLKELIQKHHEGLLPPSMAHCVRYKDMDKLENDTTIPKSHSGDESCKITLEVFEEQLDTPSESIGSSIESDLDRKHFGVLQYEDLFEKNIDSNVNCFVICMAVALGVVVFVVIALGIFFIMPL